MNRVRKTRADAKLKALPEERQAEIVEYALTHTQVNTCEWLRQGGLSVNIKTLREFLCFQQIQQQMALNECTVKTMIGELAKKQPTQTPEQLEQIGQAFFTKMAMEQKDQRGWFLTQELALKKGKLELDWQKYRDQVEERRAAMERTLQAAKSSGGLTPETLEKIERELKLL
jgi:hypothetical protein